MKISRILFAVTAAVTCGLFVACKGSEKSGAGGGTLVISTGADADVLLPPFVATTMGRQVSEQLFEPLVDIGDDMNLVGDKGFIPRLADRWDWGPDSLSIVFHLNPNARWHDGVRVTAKDVLFTFRLYRDTTIGAPLASVLGDIDSVTVRDSLTPVYWMKQRSPREFYTAASQFTILPEHVYGTIPASALAKSEIARKPIGSGRFKFVRWVPNASIELAANTEHYRQRAMLDRVIWTIAPGDFNTAVARLMSGDADVFETMRPEIIAQAAQGNTVKVVTYPGVDYAMLLFNLRDIKTHSALHPLFSDRNVRRALTMAIDRKAIVQNVLDSLGAPAVGPTVRSLPSTDTTMAQIPYNPTAAAALLDSLGWKDPGNSGVRKKGNQALSFTVITPSSSKNRERCAVLIQEQLRKIGVQMNIEPMEMAALVQHEDARDFDAIMLALHLDGSPGGLKQSWSAAEAANPHGTNYGSYVNPRFDAQVDSALEIWSPDASRAAFTKAYRTIIDDAPAVWLYDLKGAIGVNKRLQVAPLRPDAWWAHLADWSIPADQRIARDKVPPQGQ